MNIKNYQPTNVFFVYLATGPHLVAKDQLRKENYGDFKVRTS